MFQISNLLGESTDITVRRPTREIMSWPTMRVKDPILRFQPGAMSGCVTEIVFDPCTATPSHKCLTRDKVIFNSGKVGVTIAFQVDDQHGPKTFVLQPGQLEIVPAGMWHAVINSSSEIAIITVVNSCPPEPGDVLWEDDPPKSEAVAAGQIPPKV